jgi:hypothetical protein
MHSATIPLAAVATFAAVYWLTPAPARVAEAGPVPARAVQAEPGSVPEAAAPVPDGAGPSRRMAVPAARAAKGWRARPARTRRPNVASYGIVRPARRASVTRVYFSGCNAVRAAGLAPLLRGEPGYRPEMDGDDDGIACEPYRGRRR